MNHLRAAGSDEVSAPERTMIGAGWMVARGDWCLGGWKRRVDTRYVPRATSVARLPSEIRRVTKDTDAEPVLSERVIAS